MVSPGKAFQQISPLSYRLREKTVHPYNPRSYKTRCYSDEPSIYDAHTNPGKKCLLPHISEHPHNQRKRGKAYPDILSSSDSKHVSSTEATLPYTIVPIQHADIGMKRKEPTNFPAIHYTDPQIIQYPTAHLFL